MNKRAIFRLICLILSLLLLTGCAERVRLTSESASESQGNLPGAAAPSPDAQSVEEGDAPAEEENTEQSEAQGEVGEPDPNAPTRNDPTAQRREYASDASAELTDEAADRLYVPGDGAQAPRREEEPVTIAGQAEEAELTATETLTQDEAEELGVSEVAPRADTILQYYQTLLESRLDTLFECQRFYVYWETPEDYRTIFKTSTEHTVILLAGGYDVSAKRMEDALIVDDGWIGRKNPGCIVKCVDAQILGGGVHSATAAQSIRNSLLARTGWTEMNAVKSQRVILVSEELLETPAGQVAAALYIAKAMYPDLFEDTNPEQALEELFMEETGLVADGIYAYEG